MILRRVIVHVKAQNWFAVAIDFVIVVVGVFIGIQVSNWNAARTDHRAAANYLAGIASDVRADITEIARVSASARTRIAASAYLLQQSGSTGIASAITLSEMSADDVFSGSEVFGIPEQGLPEDARRDRLWALATGIYAFDTNKSAYDALIGSGRIELIESLEIKRALQEYYYLVNALEETQRRTFMPMRTFVLQKGIAQGLSPSGSIAENALVERMIADPTLAAAIATSREHAALYLLFCGLIDAGAERVLALLKEAETKP